MNSKQRKINTILSDVTEYFFKKELILSTSNGKDFSESTVFSHELARRCFERNTKVLIVKLSLVEMERLDLKFDELLNLNIEVSSNYYFDELDLTKLSYELARLKHDRSEDFQSNSYDLIIYHIIDGLNDLVNNNRLLFANKNLLLLIKKKYLTQNHLSELADKVSLERCFIVRF